MKKRRVRTQKKQRRKEKSGSIERDKMKNKRAKTQKKQRRKGKL